MKLDCIIVQSQTLFKEKFFLNPESVDFRKIESIDENLKEILQKNLMIPALIPLEESRIQSSYDFVK